MSSYRAIIVSRLRQFHRWSSPDDSVPSTYVLFGLWFYACALIVGVTFCCLQGSAFGNTFDDIKTPRCRSAGVSRLGAWQLEHTLMLTYTYSLSSHVYCSCVLHIKNCVYVVVSHLELQGQMLQTQQPAPPGRTCAVSQN
jgi:hypothetical protein